ncbi:hypothetical protein DENSPDRAFT_227129 [Dentipellis sp. KUC8613]|nr:hypothetical protein DENSPDRAFT_227129 [Dentipellis sp. KUC8613]
MSIAILSNRPRKMIYEHRDDLESIFWVLVFHVLRYQPSVAKVMDGVNDQLQQIFDSSCEDDEGRVYGGKGKVQFVSMSILRTSDMQEAFHSHLAGLLLDLLKIFHIIYSGSFLIDEESRKAALESLRNMNTIRDLFQKRLAEGDWPEDDAAVDPRWLEADGTLERKGKKRPRAAAEDNEGYVGSGQSTSKRSKKSGTSLCLTSISQAVSDTSLPRMPE